MSTLKRIKGTQDILPEESEKWIALENIVRHIMTLYNFSEIRTPVFEQTELFARGIGQLTDIVAKEMYTFYDRGGKQLTLKPEMTAPIIRAYLENKMYARQPLNKVYYIAPLFRQENPQAGRLRQFHQFGAETLGSADADADVEMIDLAMAIYDRLGIRDLKLSLNSVGDPACRGDYRNKLRAYIEKHLNGYCDDCRRRYQDNPMRVLDCKNEGCRRLNRQAPKMADNLCADCQSHYDRVREMLTRLELPFEEDPYLVRGLDYYTRTVFEISSEALGAQNAICGGGRYDLLAEELGGAATPAVGFASGIERLLMVVERQNVKLAGESKPDIFLAAIGDKAKSDVPAWLKKLRRSGWRVETDYLDRSIKAQMREANRQQTRFVLILGEEELQGEQFTVKLMAQGRQEQVPFERITSFLDENRN